MTHRFACNPIFTEDVRLAYAGGEPILLEKELEAPLHKRKPCVIGTQFMGDLFHESVPFEWIEKVYSTIARCPQHTFQVLTKRIERALEFYEDAKNTLPRIYWGSLKNIWLGVTAENQEQADKRIPILLQIPAAKRFVSCEPLLENLKLKTQNLKLLDWVIVGCESGPKRRLCKIEWIESIVQQCKAAQVTVFIKQVERNGKVEHDVNKFPEPIRFQEFLKDKK